jgi:hypothetical protein
VATLPRYQNADMTRFLSRVTAVNDHFERWIASSLRPLINILEDNNGTAVDVANAVNAVPQEKKQKYLRAIRYLLWTYPGLTTYLGNDVAALRTVVTNELSTDAQIQAELDQVPAATASNFEQALIHLVQLRPGVEYIGLEGFAAVYNGVLTSQSNHNGTISYTTPHFHATAQTYSVVPAGVGYDLGFIQACEAKACIHTYSDENLNTRWKLQGAAFPISDSSSVHNIPFYHVGIGFACTHHTARRNHQLGRHETYDLDDNFNNNAANTILNYRKGLNDRQSRLRRIRRQQDFRAWFAVKRATQNAYRLLREVTYGFDFTIDITHTQHAITTTRTAIPVLIGETAPGGPLPNAALNPPIMNGNEVLKVYVNHHHHCNINQTIVIP